MSPDILTCGMCGAEHPQDELTEFDSQLVCSHCLEVNTYECRHCGRRIWRDDNCGEWDFPLCECCYDNYYTRCENCRGIISLDDAHYPNFDDEPYCDDCYDKLEDRSTIHEYDYKPDPIFYGEGNRFFGVELEIDRAGEDSGNAQIILDKANRTGEYIYIKHDGSLDDGFEIVTHPMALAFHEQTMPWLSIVDSAIQMGYTSHLAKTCGLHVHVNRTTFGETEYEQEPAIARVLYFFEKHWEELLKFSRRTQGQLERWAARYGYKEHPRDILDHAKKGYGGGRYTCVNITNYNTIEFRMFRGTLKYNTIIATLQLLDRICDVAIFMSDEEIKALSWTSFVAAIDEGKYPQLVTYLKERRLYVNEETESGGEV